MADTPANALLEKALARYKANPDIKGTWEVARQLGQGDVYVASISPERDATSPTAIPGAVAPESVLALPSPKGPVLAVFTKQDGPTSLPGESAPNITARPQSALGVAHVAAQEPYAGLVINPGTDQATVVPAELLRVALPHGRTNVAVKELLGYPNPTPEQKAALIKALASGPVYTPVHRDSLGEALSPKFPVIPLDGTEVAEPGKQEAQPDTPTAVVFGTSPAEIALVFDPNEWVPVPVRIGDVLQAVGKTSNVKRILLNPGGPSLHLPVGPPPPNAPAPGSASDINAAFSGAPVPTENDNGPGTEPDAGTREGED